MTVKTKMTTEFLTLSLRKSTWRLDCDNIWRKFSENIELLEIQPKCRTFPDLDWVCFVPTVGIFCFPWSRLCMHVCFSWSWLTMFCPHRWVTLLSLILTMYVWAILLSLIFAPQLLLKKYIQPLSNTTSFVSAGGIFCFPWSWLSWSPAFSLELHFSQSAGSKSITHLNL